jgi:hypothetical protein
MENLVHVLTIAALLIIFTKLSLDAIILGTALAYFLQKNGKTK